MASPEAVVYRLCWTRPAIEARALLAEYRGTEMCDGFTAYENLARAGPRAGKRGETDGSEVSSSDR